MMKVNEIKLRQLTQLIHYIPRVVQLVTMTPHEHFTLILSITGFMKITPIHDAKNKRFKTTKITSILSAFVIGVSTIFVGYGRYCLVSEMENALIIMKDMYYLLLFATNVYQTLAAQFINYDRFEEMFHNFQLIGTIESSQKRTYKFLLIVHFVFFFVHLIGDCLVYYSASVDFINYFYLLWDTIFIFFIEIAQLAIYAVLEYLFKVCKSVNNLLENIPKDEIDILITVDKVTKINHIFNDQVDLFNDIFGLHIVAFIMLIFINVLMGVLYLLGGYLKLLMVFNLYTGFWVVYLIVSCFNLSFPYSVRGIIF